MIYMPARRAEMNMSHYHTPQISNVHRAFGTGIMLNVIFVAIKAG
jgi:hypothetical protein